MNRADEFTVRLLTDAGIGAGQRILEIGSGAGAVSRMIRELVGASGEVLGVDQNADALDSARANLAEFPNVRFLNADLNALPGEIGQVDAIVCRRVLMYQANAIATLRHLRTSLKPGGVLLIQEHDATGAPIHHASLPLHKHVHALIFETLKREKCDVGIGFRLASALDAAGFDVDELRVQATVLSPTMGHPIEAIVRSMLPRMIATGVTAEDDLDVDGLDLRLAQERREANATVLWEWVFGAVARSKDRIPG